MANAPHTHREVHFGDRVVRCFDERPRSFHDLLAAAVANNPNGEALVCDETRLSWRELSDLSSRVAGSIAQRGIRAGDRVAVLLGNRIEWITTLFALMRLGAIFVPLGIRQQGPELAYELADSGAKMIIYEEALEHRLPSPKDLPTLVHRIAVSKNRQTSFQSNSFAGANRILEPATIAEDDTAVIIYTSGTTGRPKGAMLSHLNIIHSAIHFVLAMDLTVKDRSIAAVPLSHVTGLVAHVATITHCAGTLILMPEFHAADFLALAARERMSHAILVPAMYNLCLLHPDFERLHLPFWRIGGYGGAIMPPSTIAKLATCLPNLTLMNCYGATETSSPATIMPRGMTLSHPESVGCAVECAEVMIMNDSHMELSPGEIGEIWIGGPMVVKGYWNNPVATNDAFMSGFWQSGDLGSVDRDGFVYVVDRKKDLINRGGYKVYSAEVEHVLLEYPGVVECAVTAKPCLVLGERVHAFVVQQHPGIDAPALRAFCAERLADYKVPETFTLTIAPLPRNANGKLLKQALRQQFLGASAQDVPGDRTVESSPLDKPTLGHKT